MNMKAVCIVRFPLELVWSSVRDRLPELASFMDDIESVTPESQTAATTDVVKIVNCWKARPKLPGVIAPYLPKSATSWTDTAVWHNARHLCEWVIEPHFFTKYIECSGTTQYEGAMGGIGTRMTFQGQFTISPTGLPIPKPFQATVARGVDSLLSTTIPKNFVRLGAALDNLLGRKT